MTNPWEEISLDDYEKHMSLDSVRQLQALDSIMKEQWVSESPYLRAFDRLDEVHHQMEEKALTAAMNEIGYSLILQETCPLPNGKAMVRVDFEQNEVIVHGR